MCGIVGYVGKRPALPILLDGLRRLEYRGYDSAGVAILDGGEIAVRRSVGKIAALEAAIGPAGSPARIGIGHTRWATHGRPTEQNAHPHRSGPFVVVHNGIIENHLALKKRLQGRGYAFSSETDTEVVAVLLHSHYRGGDARRALARTLAEIEGSYALGDASASTSPAPLRGARGQPAGDRPRRGREVPRLGRPGADRAHPRGDLPRERRDGRAAPRGRSSCADAAGKARRAKLCHIPWDPVSAERGGYKHFMLKEIHEQPTRLPRHLPHPRQPGEGARAPRRRGRPRRRRSLAGIRRVRFLACGTSWHAALVGEHMVERLAGCPPRSTWPPSSATATRPPRRAC